MAKPRILGPYNPLAKLLLVIEVAVLKEVALLEIYADNFIPCPDDEGFIPSEPMRLRTEVVKAILKINSDVLDKVIKRISRIVGATMATKAIVDNGDENKFSISNPDGTSSVFRTDIRRGEFFNSKVCDGITFMSSKLFATVQWAYQMATRFGVYGAMPEYEPNRPDEDDSFDGLLVTRAITRISMSEWKELGFKPSVASNPDLDYKVLTLQGKKVTFSIKVIENHTIDCGEIYIYNYGFIETFSRHLERWSLGHLFEISVLSKLGMVKGHVMVQKPTQGHSDLTVFEINIKKEVTLIPEGELWIAMAPTPKKSYGFSHFDWQSIINILLFQSSGNDHLLAVLKGTAGKVKDLLNSFLEVETLRILQETPDITGPEAAKLFVKSFNFNRYVDILKKLTGDVDNEDEVKAMTLLLEGVKSGKVKIQTLLAKGLTLVNHLLKQMLDKMEYDGASGYVVCDPVYLLSGGKERSVLTNEIAVVVLKGKSGKSIAHRRPTMLEQVSCMVYNVNMFHHVVNHKKLLSFGIVWNQHSGALLANAETVLLLVKVLDFDQDDCVEFHTDDLGETGDIILKTLPVIGSIEPRNIQEYKSSEMSDSKIVCIRNERGEWIYLSHGFNGTWEDISRSSYRMQELKVTKIPSIGEVVGCMMRLMAVLSEPGIFDFNMRMWKPRDGEPNIMDDIKFIFKVPVSAALDMEKSGKVYKISASIKACTGRLYRFLKHVPFWYSTPVFRNMSEFCMFNVDNGTYSGVELESDKVRFISELAKFTYKGVDDEKSIPCYRPKDDTHNAFMALFRHCNSVVSYFSLFGTLSQFKDNLGDPNAMRESLVELIQSTRTLLLFPNNYNQVDNKLDEGYRAEAITNNDFVYGAYLVVNRETEAPNFQIVGNQMNSSHAFKSAVSGEVSHNQFKLPDLASVLQKIEYFYRGLTDEDNLDWYGKTISCAIRFIKAMYSKSNVPGLYNIPFGDVIPGHVGKESSEITLINGKALEIGDSIPTFGDINSILGGALSVEYPSFVNGYWGGGSPSKNRHPNEDPYMEATPIASVLCKKDLITGSLVLAAPGEAGTLYIPVLGIKTKNNKYFNCAVGLKYKMFRSFLSEFKSSYDEHNDHHAATISLSMVCKCLLQDDAFRFGIKRSFISFFLNDSDTKRTYGEITDLNAVRFLLNEMIGNAASIPTNGIDNVKDNIDLSNKGLLDVIGHLHIPSFNKLYEQINSGEISLSEAMLSVKTVCYRNRIAARGAGMLSHIATISMIMEAGYGIEDIYKASASKFAGHELSQLIKDAYRKEGEE